MLQYIYLNVMSMFYRLFDKNLENNPEQYQAVQHIVAGSSRPAPYLIFGPPGTGTNAFYIFIKHCKYTK